MRTTIEIADEHRAKLLEIAALRGEKGFSGIVGGAIALYLKQIPESEDQAQEGPGRQGSFFLEGSR